MINKKTENAVVLGMLGKGADGNVLLVANKKGEVAALKLIKVDERNAEMEAKNWTEIYSEYCKQYDWSVRSEKWMGVSAVVLPVLNQFVSKEERLENLDGVKECLKLIQKSGYIHGDVYWRNIGYFKDGGKKIIIMLDLHPTRVYKEENDGTWIDFAIENLEKRADCLPVDITDDIVDALDRFSIKS